MALRFLALLALSILAGCSTSPEPQSQAAYSAVGAQLK
jgi:hypothetical protein